MGQEVASGVGDKPHVSHLQMDKGTIHVLGEQNRTAEAYPATWKAML